MTVDEGSVATPIRVFYRIVKADPPTIEDFKSNEELGRPLLDPDAERQWLWSGISVYAAQVQAARTVRRFPRLGKHIAQLHIPEATSIAYERTTAQPGHYTLWGDPDEIANCVVTIVPVG